MKKEIEIDHKCTGCNSCVAVCPKNAITLKISGEGFWYPEISQSLCNHCGKCSKICPVYGEKMNYDYRKPDVYAAWSNDKNNRHCSSSGGIFGILARFVLNSAGGGSVYGAAYDAEWQVSHIRIDCEEELKKLQGSKYVQSYIDQNIYEWIQKDLLAGRKVLFSGTPCQVSAVGNLYGSNPNLLLVDIICHGVPSPKAWDNYLNQISSDREIADINMRSKDFGWNKFHFRISFEDGDKIDEWFNDNIYGKSFVRNLFLRNCCYQCLFKNDIRYSDISLGDLWEAARGKHRELDDDDQGTSVVLINSEKGHNAFEQIKEECFTQEIPYEWVPEKTYALIKSSPGNENREKAFKKLGKKKFDKIVKQYTTWSFWKKLVNKAISFSKFVHK